MIINCHTRIFEVTQFSNGTDFTLPGSTADRYIYAYSYDSFGRLTESARYAGFSVNPNNIFTEKNLTYDRNGNILTLTRYGNGNATIKDNFIYSYDGNQLKKLDGTFNGSAINHTAQSGGNTIQNPGTADYIYDGNGNMTLDALRNITLTYDINNLVSTVSRNDTLLSTYHYLADGTKYKVMDPDNNGRVYIGPFSYTTAKTGNTVYSYLEGIDTDGGRIMIVRKQSGTQNTYDYTTAFFVRDHLGSTRVMLNAQGDILERNAYYPFGLQMNQGKAYPTLTERLPQLYSGYISPTPARRDLYNGKELQTASGTDYLDYGFRQYDQTISRWFNIDPKAEKYLPMTPYNYCAGNPVIYRDFVGDSIVIDNYGYILHYDKSDTDLRVFMNGKVIGALGRTIDADIWFSNLLSANLSEFAENFNPISFCKRVKTNGDWDYKNRVKLRKTDTRQQHIIGIAFYRKDKDNGSGDLGETLFSYKGFNGEKGRAEDLNNFHYGVIGESYPMFNEDILLRAAGLLETIKRVSNNMEIHKEWIPMEFRSFGPIPFISLQYPFGDNPDDSKWIQKGVNYYKSIANGK